MTPRPPTTSFPMDKEIRVPKTRTRLAVAGFTVTLALSLAACGGSDDQSAAGGSTGAPDRTWTMVTDQAGLGDQGFNDLAKKGIDESASTLGGKAQVIQSDDQAQYVANLTQAVSGGATVTTAVGSLLTDAVAEVAESNPDAKITLIDSVATGEDGQPLSNVAGVTFREQEGSFLAGVVAGLTTKSNKVGFIGGMEVPAVVRFHSGFAAGVKSVNPSATVSLAYVGSFTDSAKGKSLAQGMYDSGVDIVMESAGGGGLGVYEAAKAEGAAKKVIGVDACKIQLAPDNVLTSVVKDVAGAVLKENQAAADGTFKGGEINLGLKDDAVGLCQDNYGALPADVRAKVDAAKTAISAGSLTPPATEQQLTAFKPAAL